MNIIKMTATFGRLEGETLALTPGLNVFQAPNEGGKSTWCAFLRAMLYGIPTKERDRAGYLAEKNRYQPWSGSPMEGQVDITWKGSGVTLRRYQKGSIPFGGFEAVDTDTGLPVPGLTADNVGETLVGVPREVFERSAFVGQSGVAVDGSPELEKRIAALVSSGEEDVSFTQTQRTLKDWLNRRKHNKSGLIPKLEGEAEELDALLARLDQVGRTLAEGQGEQEALERHRDQLAAEQKGQQARADSARRADYDKAVVELTGRRAELAALLAESGPLPDKDTLREAQSQLLYYNNLVANAKVTENQLVDAQQAAREATQAAQDPIFQDLTADGAWEQATADAQAVQAAPKRGWLWLVAAIAFFIIAAGWLFVPTGSAAPLFSIAFAALGVANLVLGLRGKKRLATCQGILDRYGAQTAADITARAQAYRAKCATAEAAVRSVQTLTETADRGTTQRAELIQALRSFVAPFAPTVTDGFGIAAALSKALSLDERVAAARIKLEGAQRLVSSLPAPTGDPLTPLEGPISDHTPQQTAAMLAAVQGELGRVTAALAMAQGQRDTLGDPTELGARRGAVEEDLTARRGEYQALSLALEVLDGANADLQSRFSPVLNQKASEAFAALTGGKYEDLTLTRDFDAAAREAGTILPRRVISLSQGTADQLYLAVRLAVCHMALPADDPSPLVLDDALTNFDDGRMALALGYLHDLAKTRQILLFTCQSREKTALAFPNELGYNHTIT